VNIPRSDLRTAIMVQTVCQLYDETRDFTTAMNILSGYVSNSVAERVLFHPENRRGLRLPNQQQSRQRIDSCSHGLLLSPENIEPHVLS